MRSRRRPRPGPSVHLATDVPRTRCSRGWSRRSWQPGALISRVPLHGYLALGLIAAAWPASWLRIGSFGEYAFFPLWLGYILAVDALVLRRTAGSLLTRNRAVFAAMFLASIPLWWGFEGINYFTQNWHYLGGEEYSALKYALLASWHFSIVIPAVFETTELVGSLKFVNAFSRGPKLPVSSRLVAIAITGGMTALLAVLVWPQYAFPLTWLSVLLILDPINQLWGRPSLLSQVQRGDWRLVVALGLGALICGWFWEMWNFWAFPKWYYTIPIFEHGRIFEMPVLGYGGYIPFGLEVYAAYHFLIGLAGLASQRASRALSLAPKLASP